MPVIGSTLTSASYDKSTKQITCNGTNFGKVQYPVCNIQVSILGIIWTDVNTIDVWGNLQSKGTFSSALPPGVYKARVITSNNATLTLASAFVVAAISSGQSQVSVRVGIGVF